MDGWIERDATALDSIVLNIAYLSIQTENGESERNSSESTLNNLKAVMGEIDVICTGKSLK